MANETQTKALDLASPELAAAARAAGYRSARLGPALYALEFLHASGGDEAVAEALLRQALDARRVQ